MRDNRLRYAKAHHNALHALLAPHSVMMTYKESKSDEKKGGGTVSTGDDSHNLVILFLVVKTRPNPADFASIGFAPVIEVEGAV